MDGTLEVLDKVGTPIAMVLIFLTFILKMWAVVKDDVKSRDKSYEALVKGVSDVIERNTTALTEQSRQTGEMRALLQIHREHQSSLQHTLDRLSGKNNG